MRFISHRTGLWFTLILLFMFPVITPQAQSDSLTQDDFNRIAPSVVYIESVVGRFIDSSGSGTIISPTGRIYTNRHVIEGADDLHIYLQTEIGELPVFSYRASLVDVYDEIDFAVLQIDRDASGRRIDPETLELPYIEDFADGALLGERVYIFGFPSIGNGYLVVTQGAMTSIENGTLNGERQPLWYRTDADISPGNSGGLAVNGRGQFIGIPTEVRKEERTLGRIGGMVPVIAIETVLANRPQTDNTVVTQPIVSIVNNSASEIVCYVYISPTTSTTWGSDWLQSDTIRPGESSSWRVESGAYDVLLRDCESEELANFRALQINEAITLTYPQSTADVNPRTTAPPPTAQPTPARTTATRLTIEILDIEHNVSVPGRSENGMKIYTYIRATGYRGVAVRAGIFFFWEDDTPVSGSNAPVVDRTTDGDLTTQAVITPAYADTEWTRYWFWVPYNAFPLGFSGEQAGYAQAYIGTEDDDFLGNPSNTFDFVVIYPD